MRKPVIAAVMVWSVVCSAGAGEVFSLRIDAYPAVAPRGCPIEITVEIRNVSGHAVTTGRNILRSGGYGLPDEGGGYFSLVAKVQDATGSSVAPCPRQFIEDDVVVGPETPSVLPANWQLRFRAPLCIDHVGSYKVMLVAREQGPFIDRFAKKEFEIWSGEVDSQEVAISVVEPTGIDLEAYEYFKGQPMSDTTRWGELLRKFPTSIYAGYALMHRGPSQALWSFTSLNDPDGELRKYSDMGGGEDNLRRRIAKAQAEMQAYAEAAGLFLKAHPDFLHAPFIRRMYAMCLGLTGHMPDALAEIQTLSTGTGKEAAEAKAFLAESASTKPRN